MSEETQKDKDHSQFIAVLTARIAAFMNEMTQYCLHNLQNGPQKRSSKKRHPQDESTSQNIQNDMTKGDQQQKRKFYKARNRLPLKADSERPKAPTSSFLIYYHENKLKLGQKYGQTNVSKLTKLASQEWRGLPEQQRQKYLKISQQSKCRYQKQMEIFKTKYADQIEEAMKKRRAEYRTTWMTKKKALLQKQKEKEETLGDNSSLQFSQEECS